MQSSMIGKIEKAHRYAKEPERVPALRARFEAIEAELMDALERWEALASR